MKWFILLVLTATTVAALHPTSSVIAAEKKTTTVVTISGLHCAVCAKKVAKKLEAVTHVASVTSVSSSPFPGWFSWLAKYGCSQDTKNLISGQGEEMETRLQRLVSRHFLCQIHLLFAS